MTPPSATERACRIAVTLDGAGGWQSFAPSDGLLKTPEAAGPFWLHVAASHPSAKDFLRGIGMPAHAAAALLAQEVRPRYEQSGDASLIILRGITNIPGPTPDDMASVRLYVTPQGIVSSGRRPSRVMGDIKTRLRDGEGPRSVAEMVTMLLAVINDALEPVLQEVEDTVETYEEQLLGDIDGIPRAELAELRKEISQYRRHLSPQRDVLNRLAHSDAGWLPHDARWQVQEASDRTTRFIEDLDSLRERSEIVADDVLNAQSMRLNKNLYLLSLMTVVFMPLTFLTGLLGMNVEGIPGAGHPDAFGVIVLVSLGLMLAQVLLFRLYRWL